MRGTYNPKISTKKTGWGESPLLSHRSRMPLSGSVHPVANQWGGPWEETEGVSGEVKKAEKAGGPRVRGQPGRGARRSGQGAWRVKNADKEEKNGGTFGFVSGPGGTKPPPTP